LKCFLIEIKCIIKRKLVEMENTFYSALRNENVYLYDPNVVASYWIHRPATCWEPRSEYVTITYKDGRTENILCPFTAQMDVAMEEEKQQEEEKQEEEEEEEEQQEEEGTADEEEEDGTDQEDEDEEV
jgi:hypothetical protein